MTIWLPGIMPKTSHHAKRITRVRTRRGTVARMADTARLNRAKRTLDDLLEPYVPSEPMRGPVSLSLAWTWPWTTKDTAASKRATNGRVWHDRRPDCSNLTKTIEDRLVACGFLVDDGQVVLLEARKFRGDTPGLWIQLEEAPCEPWDM